MPEVYGYLASRCGSATVAEDLTSETFLAASDAVKRGTVADLTVAWLIGVARHKLVDHWRRRERDDRLLAAVDAEPDASDDPWDVQLDHLLAHRVLAQLGAHDPFEDLASPFERREPRTSFRRALRQRLVSDLGLAPEPDPPTVDLPARKRTMSTTTMSTTTTPRAATAVATPYLAARDAAGALDWYVRALGAVEELRVVGDDGRLGHAEFSIGGARFMLSDEYPDLGVHSPASLGGATTTIHLEVGRDGPSIDDLYTSAVDAGATALTEPADQSHGSRHGTLVDPYGHRWMLSQQIEDVTLEEYAERSAGSGFEVVGTQPGDTVIAADRPGTGGGIWAGVFYDDALAGIRFLTDTFGFEEQIVVTGDDGTTVVHSQLRWPEGGIVQAGTYDADNVFTQAPGEQSLYVVTADPQSVWDRCVAADLEVIREPESPDYDPDGMGFAVRDPEGNIWSFGSYGLGEDR